MAQGVYFFWITYAYGDYMHGFVVVAYIACAMITYACGDYMRCYATPRNRRTATAVISSLATPP